MLHWSGKGKKNRPCYNELDSLSSAENNPYVSANRDCYPSRQQGDGFVGQLCSGPTAMCRCYLLQTPRGTYTEPISLRCSSLQQPSHHHAQDSSHPSQEHRSTSCTLPYPAPHENSYFSSLPFLDGPLWESSIFYKLFLILQKSPKPAVWPLCHSTVQPQSHRLLWSK